MPQLTGALFSTLVHEGSCSFQSELLFRYIRCRGHAVDSNCGCMNFFNLNDLLVFMYQKVKRVFMHNN